MSWFSFILIIDKIAIVLKLYFGYWSLKHRNGDHIKNIVNHFQNKLNLQLLKIFICTKNVIKLKWN